MQAGALLKQQRERENGLKGAGRSWERKGENEVMEGDEKNSYLVSKNYSVITN